MKEMPKEKHRNIKTDKRKSAAKVGDNVQQSESRLHWESTQTITGYKRKKGACLQAAAADSKVANDLNVFYTRFDQRDFSALSKHRQLMEKVQDQRPWPFVTNEENVRLNFRNINSKSASGPDDGSGKSLKLCSDSLAPVLTELLQRSFNVCVCPSTKGIILFQKSGRCQP